MGRQAMRRNELGWSVTGRGGAKAVSSTRLKHPEARTPSWGSGLLCVLLLVFAVSCAGPATRQDIQREGARSTLVVTTTGVSEFLSRELLRGVADTRLLGPQVPRERRAEPTPDEVVMIARASLVVAYGGEADRNYVEMVRRESPEKPMVVVRDDLSASGFAWLEAATLRDDARRLHEQLTPYFDSSRDRSRLEANLADLEGRLAVYEETMAEQREIFSGQRFFTDDRRIHGFLRSMGIGIIETVEMGENGIVADEQRDRLSALAAGLPVRILIVTHPEKKERLSELAREADLTLVYFNPFLDGAPGVGQIDTVVPRQLRVLRLVLSSALASSDVE